MKHIRVNVPVEVRAAVLIRDKSTCQLCGRKAPKVIMEVDHIIPVSRGGTNNMNNLQSLCKLCNVGKSNMVVSDMIWKAQTFYKKARRKHLCNSIPPPLPHQEDDGFSIYIDCEPFLTKFKSKK
ncbi:HNH endonuclease [Paenibacillus sp. 2TAB26]|uniref:HNH endonuclease n=1 Tax=Paenibacillus sp. 2TAB26 TaxID=3233005 RepID=UPI003F9CBB1B